MLDRLQIAADRVGLMDVPQRYCRAIDRHDLDLVRSVYHFPGAGDASYQHLPLLAGYRRARPAAAETPTPGPGQNIAVSGNYPSFRCSPRSSDPLP